MGFGTKKQSIEHTAVIRKRILVSLLAAVTLLVLAATSFIIDPIFVILSWCSRIDYGTVLHEVLSGEAESIHLSAYLFNVTNAERFLSGEDRNLRVQEVGPFTYQENRSQKELVIDKDAGVMSYIPSHRVMFLPEKSIGDPRDMHVVLPNMAMLSMSSKLSPYSFVPKMAFNILASRLKSQSIIRLSVQDFLWGYDEALIRFGNSVLPGWIDFSRLGLLDRLYDDNSTFVVRTTVADKFAVRSVNGFEGLNKWGYEDPKKRSRCNTFIDVYEGIGYPPKLATTRPLRIYRPILCRFLDLEYLGPRHMDYGVDVSTYRISNKSYLKLPENNCMCGNNICQDGVSDISPCFYGLPIVLSNAHFFETDPAVYQRIDGMTPNPEDHGSDIIIEPYTGTVVTTKFAVQVNVMVDDVSFNSDVSKFSNMVVPIAYFKLLQPELKADVIDFMKLVLIRAPYILIGVQSTCLVLGVVCLFYAARTSYLNLTNVKRKGIVYELSNSEVIGINDGVIQRLVVDHQD